MCVRFRRQCGVVYNLPEAAASYCLPMRGDPKLYQKLRMLSADVRRLGILILLAMKRQRTLTDPNSVFFLLSLTHLSLRLSETCVCLVLSSVLLPNRAQ